MDTTTTMNWWPYPSYDVWGAPVAETSVLMYNTEPTTTTATTATATTTVATTTTSTATALAVVSIQADTNTDTNTNTEDSTPTPETTATAMEATAESMISITALPPASTALARPHQQSTYVAPVRPALILAVLAAVLGLALGVLAAVCIVRRRRRRRERGEGCVGGAKYESTAGDDVEEGEEVVGEKDGILGVDGDASVRSKQSTASRWLTALGLGIPPGSKILERRGDEEYRWPEPAEWEYGAPPPHARGDEEALLERVKFATVGGAEREKEKGLGLGRARTAPGGGGEQQLRKTSAGRRREVDGFRIVQEDPETGSIFSDGPPGVSRANTARTQTSTVSDVATQISETLVRMGSSGSSEVLSKIGSAEEGWLASISGLLGRSGSGVEERLSPMPVRKATVSSLHSSPSKDSVVSPRKKSTRTRTQDELDSPRKKSIRARTQELDTPTTSPRKKSTRTPRGVEVDIPTSMARALTDGSPTKTGAGLMARASTYTSSPTRLKSLPKTPLSGPRAPPAPPAPSAPASPDRSPRQKSMRRVDSRMLPSSPPTLCSPPLDRALSFGGPQAGNPYFEPRFEPNRKFTPKRAGTGASARYTPSAAPPRASSPAARFKARHAALDKVEEILGRSWSSRLEEGGGMPRSPTMFGAMSGRVGGHQHDYDEGEDDEGIEQRLLK